MRMTTKQLMQQASLCQPDKPMLIASLERELGYRKRVYLRLVNDERMSIDEAAREIACTQRLITLMKGDLF